ncbi:methyl-accepting chemotaxis protein [Aquabacterium sp.]|uniref:methyl-accepting chemotaxis protein n=1 Tax=Aquabacterium sp. TaxID=1872578 RepID=UPI0037850203
MIQQLSFKRKIGALVGVAIAGVLVLTAVVASQVQSRAVERRKSELVALVQVAHSTVEAYRKAAESGAMPVEQAQQAAALALKGARFAGPDGKPNYFYIWSLDGKGVMHPIKPEWAGQDMLGKVKDGRGNDVLTAIIGGAKASADGWAFVDTFFPRPGSEEPVAKLQYVGTVPGWNWLVGSGLYMDDVGAEVRKALLLVLAVSGSLLVVIGLIGRAVARSVLRQIGGDPAEAGAAMAQVADGNLAVRLGPAAPGSLMAGLAAMIESLRDTIAQVRQATDSIATASGQIAAGNHDLSSRTEQTASNLQQTAASMEELTGTVNQTTDAARKADQMAGSASQAAGQGGQVVEQVVATMGEINQSSKQIADIIGVIDGIAFQTNILALNAAVEAARAGEQGRGFAVVAGEVRNLAQRSAQAAKEIKSLISASVERVESGTQLVSQAGSTMQDIVASVQRVSTIIGEISHAAGEQSEGIGQVNVAVTELDRMTQQNAALVEESAAAAESLRDQAHRLAGVVQRFRIEA